jgi:hypothetical protein
MGRTKDAVKFFILVFSISLFIAASAAADFVDDGTVTDNKTGLMWQSKDNGQTYSWYAAMGIYKDSYNPKSLDICGTLNFGGHTDWRLPSKKELMSLVVKASNKEPTINAAYFPNTRLSYYWSSDTVDNAPVYAWSVDFSDGTLKSYNKGTSGYVRCVRNTLNVKGQGRQYQEGQQYQERLPNSRVLSEEDLTPESEGFAPSRPKIVVEDENVKFDTLDPNRRECYTNQDCGPGMKCQSYRCKRY